MNDDFTPFELAVKLKEKGYPQHQCDYAYITEDDEYEEHYVIGDRGYIPFIPYYLPTIASPTISQVLKWLWEEKKMHIEIFLYNGSYSYFIKSITQICKDDLFHKCLNEDTVDEEYATYEQAAFAGIEYVLDNLI